MAVKIRLARHGKKGFAFYHIVAADSRAPRDGKFIEKLGTYNPNTNPATIDLNFEKALDWLLKGAQPTDTCRAILSYKGVMYKKHLLGGVAKGAFSESDAEAKFNKWLSEKQTKIENKTNKLASDAKSAEKSRLAAETKIKEERAAALAEKKAAAEAAAREAAEAAAADGLMDMVRAIRNVRAEMNVPPAKRAHVTIVTNAANEAACRAAAPYLNKLAGASTVSVQLDKSGIDRNAVSVVSTLGEAFMPMNELIDIAKELDRLAKDRKHWQSEVSRAEGKLNNQGFLAKAPEKVVEEERSKLEKAKEMLAKLEARIAEMQSM